MANTRFLFTTVLILVFSFAGQAQLLNHYWGHNFNSTSSLLGGAVIAGEADNTAIYYNPATISEMKTGSNLSIAANLFSWNFYNLNNAFGENINISTDNFLVQPQFVSYTYTPKKVNGISIAFSALTRTKEKLEVDYAESTYVDVINRYPGDDKYNTAYRYRNDYTDSWVGAALSQKISDRFSYGVSMFVSFSTLKYSNEYSATAYNASDTIGVLGLRLSEGSYSEYASFTDYRLIFKLGFAYNYKRWRFGISITTPNINLFSGGKSASRVATQTNIAYEGSLLPDFVIFDGQSKSQLKTNFKMPLSIAFGFIYDIPKKGNKLYFTAEYFFGIKGYKMVDAQINTDITTKYIYDDLENKDWLSFAYGATPVINAVIGYSWALRKNKVFLNALRTDFSSVVNVDLGEYSNYNSMKTTEFNIYHYSAGIKFNIKNNRFIAGGDFAFGYRLNQKQIANFSDPVEYDPVDNRALQGPLLNTMDTYYFGFSIYVGATLNFVKDNATPTK